MSANLIYKAFDQPATFTVSASEVSTRYVDRPVLIMETPYSVGESNASMRLAVSIKPTSDIDAEMFHIWLRYVDSSGHYRWPSYYSVACPGGKWTRISGDIAVPSGITVDQIGIGVHKACTFDALDFELWDGLDATKAVSAHTPYATEGHLKAVYATQASLQVQSDRITSEVSARAQTDEVVASHTTSIGQLSDSITSAVSGSTTYTAPDGTQKTNTLATKVSQTATDVTIAIQDASTAVSTAKAAASDAATAKTDAGKASSDAAAAIAETKDLVTLRIDSSRGTVFKNNLVSTVLTVRCYKRGQELTTLEALRQAMLDETARIRWYVLREGDTDWVSLADSDHMLSNDGFTLTVTPDDVSVKCTFKAEIVTD